MPTLGVVAVVLLVVALIAVAAFERQEDSRAQHPLQMVEAAAKTSGNSVGIISPRQADRWSTGGGPRENVVKSLAEPGNAYLEPLFYAVKRGISRPGSSERCYFLAVQEGRAFHAEAVTSLMRICYLDPYPTPQSLSTSPSLYRG